MNRISQRSHLSTIASRDDRISATDRILLDDIIARWSHLSMITSLRWLHLAMVRISRRSHLATHRISLRSHPATIALRDDQHLATIVERWFVTTRSQLVAIWADVHVSASWWRINLSATDSGIIKHYGSHWLGSATSLPPVNNKHWLDWSQRSS